MTFSIVARDPQTGAFGVATATAGPMVGALVPHIRPGMGAAATQAMTNPYLAIDALSALDTRGAMEALQEALAGDDRAEVRQIIVVDRNGVADGWTGARCIGHAGHLTCDGVAVAGNMLTGETVLADMMAHYLQHRARSTFACALLAALRAGAAAGGDKRGLASAALVVHGDQAFAETDLRVDLSDCPMDALEDLLKLASAGPYHEFFSTVPRQLQ
jgi:uncharacterized Ntn-hydrolase superfamily protein